MKLPQLTLRDLFWLVLVAAMGVCWVSDHLHSAKRIRELTPARKTVTKPAPRFPWGSGVYGYINESEGKQ